MSPEPQTAGAENSGPASFRCLHCGKSIAIDVIPGTRTECPECHKPITVPAPYELRRPKKSKNKRALIYLVLLVSIPVGIYLFYNVTLWGTYRGKPMEYWFERMKKGDCKGLAKFGSRAVPQILSLLESCERKPGQTSMEGLWNPNPSIEGFWDRPSMLQANALVTLLNMGSEAAPAADYLFQLLERLPESMYSGMDVGFLRIALTNLAKEDRAVAQRLGRLVTDAQKSLYVRRNAALALVEDTGEPARAALPALIECLDEHDDDDNVAIIVWSDGEVGTIALPLRGICAVALAYTHSQEALRALEEALEKEDDPDVRGAIEAAIKELQ